MSAATDVLDVIERIEQEATLDECLRVIAETPDYIVGLVIANGAHTVYGGGTEAFLGKCVRAALRRLVDLAREAHA